MTEDNGGQVEPAPQESTNNSEATMLLGFERLAWADALKRAEKDAGDEEAFFGRNDIALEMVKCGALEEAEQLANRYFLDREEAGVQLAIAFAKAGNISRARKIAQNDYDMLGKVAEVQAEAGDIQGALETIKEIPVPKHQDDTSVPSWLDDIHGMIARELTKHGDTPAAFAQAEKSTDPTFKAVVFSDIAAAQASIGKPEDALNIYKTHEAIFDDAQREYVLSSVVKTYVKDGKEQQARSVAGEIRSARHGAKLGPDEIEMLLAKGAAANGHQAAEAYLRKADSHAGPLWHAVNYFDMYQATNDIYYFDKAFELHPGPDSDLLEKYVTALVQHGQLEKAMELVSRRAPEYKNISQNERGKIFESIAAGQAKQGDIDAAFKTLSDHEEDIGPSGEWVRAHAKVAGGIHQYRVSRWGEQELPTIDMASQSVDLKNARVIGASALESWKSFKRFDPPTFARLAHGAAEIAHAYMTDEERRTFIRDLANEFRQFRDKGMFEDGQHQAVLKHMSEALSELEDPAATGHLLETLYKNMGDTTGLRLIKTLVESGNSKAGAAGIAVLCDSETPEHVYSYLLHKLSKTGYIDGRLPGMIDDLDHGGNLRLPAWASRRVIQRLYQELNVQTDSALLGWTAKKVRAGKLDEAALDEDLDKVISYARDALERFEHLDQAELLQDLNSNMDNRAIYFMLNAGRTKYALIQHYNFDNFSGAVSKAAEIHAHIDPKLIDKRLWSNAPEGWYEAMVNRHRPDDNLVWQTEVGAAKKELVWAAKEQISGVLGEQLAWLLRGGANQPNFASYDYVEFERESYELLMAQGLDQKAADELAGKSYVEFFNGPKNGKKITSTLGETIARLIDDPDFVGSATIGDFEKGKNTLLAQLRQIRQNAKSRKDPSLEKWKDLIEQAESEDPVIAMRHLLALLSGNPDHSLNPTGAVAEWTGHFNGLATTIRESQRKGSDSRKITLRYLDGREDFAEMLRFADGAQCCFTSENTIGAVMDPSGEWRMRINRDPHWFVFSIEDTPPNTETRISSGFIFGSLAWVDRQPALALNGVYMQRKTNAAANAILEQIYERFARPMGMKYVLVGSTFGGEFEPDKSIWQPAGNRELVRPRAIVNEDGEPETQIYDDLGQTVNGTQPVPSHCWIRNV